MVTRFARLVRSPAKGLVSAHWGDGWPDTTTPRAYGDADAGAKGVKLGRKPKLTQHQRCEAIKRRDACEPGREIARSYNVNASAISRIAV